MTRSTPSPSPRATDITSSACWVSDASRFARAISQVICCVPTLALTWRRISVHDTLGTGRSRTASLGRSASMAASDTDGVEPCLRPCGARSWARGEIVAGVPVAEPVVELGGRHGPGDEVALRLVATQARQLGVGDVVLDALGDHAQAQAVGKSDGGGDKCGRASVIGHRKDKGLVKLELVDGQFTQTAQRAVAGAEVVDGDLDPALA